MHETCTDFLPNPISRCFYGPSWGRYSVSAVRSSIGPCWKAPPCQTAGGSKSWNMDLGVAGIARGEEQADSGQDEAAECSEHGNSRRIVARW